MKCEHATVCAMYLHHFSMAKSKCLNLHTVLLVLFLGLRAPFQDPLDINGKTTLESVYCIEIYEHTEKANGKRKANSSGRENGKKCNGLKASHIEFIRSLTLFGQVFAIRIEHPSCHHRTFHTCSMCPIFKQMYSVQEMALDNFIHIFINESSHQYRMRQKQRTKCMVRGTLELLPLVLPRAPPIF